MKHRILALTLALLTLLPAAGCAGKQEGENVYQVSFLSQETGSPSALVPEARTLAPEEDPVQGLLDRLLEGPSGEDLTAVIPSSVTLRGWELNGGLLTVDFSSRYASLSGIDLTLADYSVVLTLTQLEEVEAVMITAEGELIPYRDHQRLTAGDAQAVTLQENEPGEEE